MRTRSSGPAKDPTTGEVFPDSPQSTIPAFIHKPIPFNPRLDAAFPTLEFPVPQPSEQHERARRIARNNRGGSSTSGRGGSPGSVASIQGGAPEGIRLPQEEIHSTRPQMEENSSIPDAAAIAKSHRDLYRYVSILKPGKFKNDPFWTDSNELHSKSSTTEKTYDVIPTWSCLTPGVQIVVMTEMVLSFGLDSAPKLLELSPDEINKYVDLQESEARAQAAEHARTKQYIDYHFQEMLAGKIDGSSTIELLDRQFAQGSIWEPATFAIKKVDLKAGGRFLLSVGFKDESENLWRYHGMDLSDGYDFCHSGSATNNPQEVDSLNIEPSNNRLDNGQPDEIEHPEVEVEPRHRVKPKPTRNLLLEKVMKPKKTKPRKRKLLAGFEPLRTSSKLCMSISVDDILTEGSSDAEETVPVKARVARQVPHGTDLSKAVKYTKPARQWADAPNTRSGPKGRYTRKRKPRTEPEKQASYVDLTDSGPGSTVTAGKQKDPSGTYLQPPSEDAWFAPVRGRSRMAAAKAVMDEPLPGADSPRLTVVKNIAEFANPGLAAKWARNTKPTDKSKADETVKGLVLRRRSTMDPHDKSLDNFASEEPSQQHSDETQRTKRKTVTTDELLSPFDASTPGRGNRAQKWKEGTAVRTRQLSIQEQYVADENVPIEMLDAGEQILMT